MARILIPTRNRPTSLAAVLRFLDRCFPDTELIIADGSSDEHAAANDANIKGGNYRIGIDYRRYPYDMPFFDRLLDVLENEADPYFIMGSDDDYPLMDALQAAEQKLKDDSLASTAMGPTLHLFWYPDGLANARLGVVRPIDARRPLPRARQYSVWPFSTTYSVTKREVLIERYKRARSLFVPGFFDFGVGLYDCMCGKIATVPDVTFIGTRNYNHNYLRAASKLQFLEFADDVVALLDQIAADLGTYCGVPEDERRRLAEQLLRHRLAELLGAGVHQQKGFELTANFQKPIVQTQFENFRTLFMPDSPSRTKMLGYLEYIGAALSDVIGSQDNAGEPHFVASLEEQRKHVPDADAGGTEDDQQDDDGAPANRPQRRNNWFQGWVVPKTWLWRNMPGGTLNVLGIGQSNLSNHGRSTGASDFGRAIFNGETHPIQDPIPGGTGETGSIWPRVADKIAISKAFDDMNLYLLAHSGTAVADWSAGGKKYDDLRAALERMRSDGAEINCVVWHQGERDTLLETKSDAYEASFKSLHALVSEYYPDAVWLICRASLRAGVTSRQVIKAQNAIIATYANCFPGPNTDLIGPAYRRDGTHMNDEGLSRFAEALVDQLAVAPIPVTVKGVSA